MRTGEIAGYAMPDAFISDIGLRNSEGAGGPLQGQVAVPGADRRADGTGRNRLLHCYGLGR